MGYVPREIYDVSFGKPSPVRAALCFSAHDSRDWHAPPACRVTHWHSSNSQRCAGCSAGPQLAVYEYVSTPNPNATQHQRDAWRGLGWESQASTMGWADCGPHTHAHLLLAGERRLVQVTMEPAARRHVLQPDDVAVQNGRAPHTRLVIGAVNHLPPRHGEGSAPEATDWLPTKLTPHSADRGIHTQ